MSHDVRTAPPRLRPAVPAVAQPVGHAAAGSAADRGTVRYVLVTALLVVAAVTSGGLLSAVALALP